MKEKKRHRPAARDTGFGSARALLAGETALERVRRARAQQALRAALAPHQPVVKRVVAERLLHHVGFDELAERHRLSRAQVEDLLARMRPWVAQYTCAFDDDWYWVEGARVPVPDLPAAAEGRG